jgi:ketosteroid isomerase-like protein
MRPDPLAADRQFFTALVEADLDALRQILADDFVLIDVVTGSQIPKAALLAAMEGGQLVFAAIESLETSARTYNGCAVITGRTRIRGRYADSPFEAHSRYTHVYIEQHGRWRMVAAQGTRVLE